VDASIGLSLVEAMEHAVGTGDRAAAVQCLTEDVAYMVGARPTIHGVDGVLAAIAEQSRLVRWDGHTLRGVWAGEDTLVVEVESHFTRVADGRAISLPCTDIYRFRDGRIVDWRVFADMSPFHSS
jgi:ketosteroid isomerase-like protein